MTYEIDLTDISIDEHSKSLNIDGITIPVKIIKMLLEKDEFFDVLFEYAKNGGTFKLAWKESQIIFSKRDRLFKCINFFKIVGLLDETSILNDRLVSLENAVSIQNYMAKSAKITYTEKIEGTYFTIEVGEFFKVLLLDESEFTSIANRTEISGINIRYFFYMMNNYFRKSKVPEDLLGVDNILNRLGKIRTYSIVDFQSINILTESDEKLYTMITIDQSLEQEIWNKRPLNMNPLEQAIYIYLKMYFLFSYDEKFYAANQKGDISLLHKSIDHVHTISTLNNRVVCFEFTVIYAQFLSRLGLSFKSHYEKGGEDNYGDGHANLLFKYDKFLINADSVSFILKSDMFLVKIGEPLIGFACANINSNTKKEFRSILKKVYDMVKKEMHTDSNDFEALVLQYERETDNIKEIDIFEKFEIFQTLIQNCNLEGIDLLSYMLYLRKIMEPKDTEKFGVTIIRELDQSGFYKPKGIVMLNPVGCSVAPELSRYYFLDQTRELKSIDYSVLKDKFNNISLEYIEEESPKIPGI